MLETIKEMLERDPFVPFQIVMNSGDRIAIENSSLASMGDTELMYCYPRSTRIVHLRLNQITMLEQQEQQ
jgi:hypothetical protein